MKTEGTSGLFLNLYAFGLEIVKFIIYDFTNNKALLTNLSYSFIDKTIGHLPCFFICKLFGLNKCMWINTHFLDTCSMIEESTSLP